MKSFPRNTGYTTKPRKNNKLRGWQFEPEKEFQKVELVTPVIVANDNSLQVTFWWETNFQL